MQLRCGTLWLMLCACSNGEATPSPGNPLDGGGPVSCGPRDGADRPRELQGCSADPDDFEPCTADAYAACITDDGDYHRVEPSISSIGRVRAFEEIATLLFDSGQDATPEAFLQARMLYQEDEGLDSRVVRRYDPHFAPEGETDCTAEGAPQREPDYCVGPARIQPLLLGAFNSGFDGEMPRMQAARIEAGLLWFLYVSTAKESLTCTDTPKDCDSAYAYYTGGEEARQGVGLARYVAQASPQAHDAAWNALLGLRCWRDLDRDVPATRLDLRDRARAQLDRALLLGLARVVSDRLEHTQTSTGDEQAYGWTFSQVLGAVLDRELSDRDADAAEALRDALAQRAPTSAAVDAAIDALRTGFDCP